MKLSLLLHLATGALAFTLPPLTARQDNGAAPLALPDDMDGTAIQGLLLDIRFFTNNLAESFRTYKGNHSAIYYNASMLLRTMRDGLPVVRAHPPLALRDALRLLTPVKSIAQGSRRLRRAALRRRWRARRESKCDTVREYVEAYHETGLQLTEAVIDKLPAGVMRVLAPYLATSITRHLVNAVADFSREKCKNAGWRKAKPPQVTPDEQTSSTPTAGGTATGSSSVAVTSTVSASLPPTSTFSSETDPSSTESPSTTDVELVDAAASPSTVSPSTASRSTTAAPSTTDTEALDNVD